ncbi:Fic family protein [Fluviicola sp.]|uniref:Fic family protein n=1 Tax=Fluviicola sp. TaxID=1917219 RepID=UPI00260444DA|nr:Fic family protein [Fluviicola sp.]
MKSPYEITYRILTLISSISEKLGQINAKYLDKPSPKLRKENRIKTIHSSLVIEGNTLSIEQITALLDNKRIIGPEKDIREVMNANKVYEEIKSFNPHSSKSFLQAHKFLMSELIQKPGTYRSSGVGIVAGQKITHMAPPASNVPYLMKDLFAYLKSEKELSLIKSCVFHYEMEFIHPFLDGNGRMGRLWQTIILMEEYPIFEFIPFENMIHQTQADYYAALSKSDKQGHSTPFIEYMLDVINLSLNNLLDKTGNQMNTEDRLKYFSEVTSKQFTRKDYMTVFKELSTATASRDLKAGVDLNYFQKTGDKKNTLYSIIIKK